MKASWAEKRFDEVLEIRNGKNQREVESKDGEYPIFGSAGNVMGYATSFICEAGTTIIGRKGNINTPIFSETRFWNVDTAFGLAAKPGLDSKYLYYYCLSFDFSALNRGTTIPSLVKSELLGISIPVAPLPEQQRIVTLLDEAFDGIATARANAEQNLQNARALFESHLQSVLRGKKWKWKTLGELCEKVEYGTSAKSKTEGGTPVLRMGNIQDGRFVWDNLVYTDDEAEISRYLLKHNDVLFNRTNSPELVGKSAIYKSEMPAIFAGYLIRIHRNEDLLDADYLTYFLNSQIAFDYGKTVVISSVNQANINGSKLKSYPIPAPSLSEQKAIVAKLDDLSQETQRLESIYQRKLAALDALKKSLLHQAFSGEL